MLLRFHAANTLHAAQAFENGIVKRHGVAGPRESERRDNNSSKNRHFVSGRRSGKQRICPSGIIVFMKRSTSVAVLGGSDLEPACASCQLLVQFIGCTIAAVDTRGMLYFFTRSERDQGLGSD